MKTTLDSLSARSLALLGTVVLFSSCVTTSKEGSSSSNSLSDLGTRSSLIKRVPISGVALGLKEDATPIGLLDSQQEVRAKALAHYVAGLIYRSKDQNTRALEEWNHVIDLDPNREALRDLIVQEHFRRGDYKEVARLLELATQKNPDSYSYWTLLAVVYRVDRQSEKAASAARRAIQLDPSKLPPWQVLYEIALENKNPAEALRLLDKAASKGSKEHQFWLQLAELYGALEKEPHIRYDGQKVIEFYEKAMALAPDDVAVMLLVADYYSAHQNSKRAVEIYGDILKKQPGAESVRIKQALSYIILNDKTNGIQILQEVIEREPKRFQVLNLLAEIYEESKDFDQAMANHRLSLKANPNQLSPHLKIVLQLLRQKKLKEAVQELDVAREKFPNTPQISYFYGLVHSEGKEYGKAIERFEETLAAASQSNPEILDASFYFYYGSALERDGKFDKSVQQFLKAIELNPDFSEACNYLGYMYADKNLKLAEARDLIEKALAYEPNNGAFLDSLGWLCYREGKLEKAIQYLKRAITVIGDDSAVYDHLGDVYRKMGENSEALQQYKKAVELDPDNKEIKEKLNLLKKGLSASHPESAPMKVEEPAPLNP